MAELTPAQRRMGMTEADLPQKPLTYEEQVAAEVNRAAREGRYPREIPKPKPKVVTLPPAAVAGRLRSYESDGESRVAFDRRNNEHEAIIRARREERDNESERSRAVREFDRRVSDLQLKKKLDQLQDPEFRNRDLYMEDKLREAYSGVKALDPNWEP